jgi:hypothetical protein
MIKAVIVGCGAVCNTVSRHTGANKPALHGGTACQRHGLFMILDRGA